MNFKKQIVSFLSVLRGWNKPPVQSSSAKDSGPFMHPLNSSSFPVMDNALLSGKNALITGAARNIGRSIALEMARQGANVFFTDIDQEGCIKMEQELKEYRIKSKGFIFDISKTEDSDALYSFLVQEKIVIDILVHNVGIQLYPDDIQNLDLTEWHKTFNTNVFGPMYLTKHITKMMISSDIQGCILFVTSIHQSVPIKCICYSSSKAALGMIVKELSLNVASSGIRVNGIAPGWILENEQGMPFDFKYAPLHRTSINPCYIGRAAVYLASDYFSKFTTGSVITIDAGLSLFHYQMVQDLHQR
jgi:NAD(P)-dependent dehydrogenase (short-subunit alcohol dehydrogenase family)